MANNNKILKRKLLFSIRNRYSLKRQSLKWKKRKKNKEFALQIIKQVKVRQERKIPINHIAPTNFSLISNTDEVLEYFNKAERILRSKENVSLNILDVDVLTPDTLLFMVANINNPDFIHKSGVIGAPPKKQELSRLFTESGFYDHVKTRGRFSCSKENILHKEVHKKVVPDVARDVSLVGIKHVFDTEKPFEPLYEIIIECMSNTKSHADPELQGECYWWLYAYNFPGQKITSYTFLDLGVGIFESIVIKDYIKKIKHAFTSNVDLVDDLLAGKLQSRIGRDSAIRGKGIPQIVEHASTNEHFKTFFIITNDVKINLKTGSKEKLNNKLNGTLLYWEIQN